MELPPAQVTRAVIQRYARIEGRYRDELGLRPLVLPTSEFFPDRFDGDAASVSLLALRMQEHAGMDDIPIETVVVAPGAESPVSSCSSGGCATPQTTQTGLERVVDRGDSWLLQVPSAELKHSVALTTNLARALSYIFLVETRSEGEHVEPPVDVTADLVAVALGFGPLMMQGAFIYAKSCGGPQIASVTKVALPELAIAVALFAALGGHDLARAEKTLDVTQRAVLSEARTLMAGNKRLVGRVRNVPGEVAHGHFQLEEPQGFLGKLFKKRKRTKSEDHLLAGLDSSLDLDEVESMLIDMPPSSRAVRTSTRPEDPHKAELRELVQEAFRSRA